MASIGEILSRERDRQGVTLATIAQQTRIKLPLLEALEKDQHDLLPGRFFVRSFALQYAEKLGMNTDELMIALHRLGGDSSISYPAGQEVPEEPRLGTLFPERPSLEPLPEGTASVLNAQKVAHSVVMLVSVVVACGLVFWLWQRQLSTTSAETNKPEIPQSLPESVPPPAVQPIPTTDLKPAAEVAAPVASPPSESKATAAPPSQQVPPAQASAPAEALVEKPTRTAKLKRGPGSAARSKRKAKPRGAQPTQTGD